MTDAGDQASPGTTPLSEEAVALFGSDFLRFVLNGVHPGSVAGDDEPRRNVLIALEKIAALVLPIGDTFGRRNVLLGHLGQVDDSGMMLAHRMWLVAGGEMPTVSTEDLVARTLVELALAAFPFQLLAVPPDDPFPMAETTGVIYRHDAYLTFPRAVFEDPSLRHLFPPAVGAAPAEPSFPYGVDANLIWSNAGGGTLSLGLVASSALEFTFTEMRMAEDLLIENLPRYVESTVALMRKLAKERRGIVPCVVALSNVTIDPGLVVPLGAGRILGAESLRGHVRPVNQEATAVLVMDVELRLLDIIPRDFNETGDDLGNDAFGRRWRHRTPTIEAAQQALDRELTRARLAAALASTDEQLIAPIVRGFRVLNPLAGGGGGWGFNPYATSLSPQVHIDASLASSVTEWGQRVIAHPESMWMGARRLLSAMADRREALDAFIDAVVCWENLLGAETEVTFRVSAGLAALLEPDDPALRLELFEELKALYKIRSGLIHGSKEPPREEAHRHAQRAIRVAIDALKGIYNRPELLQAPSSGVRNRRLLMGA